MAHPWKPTPLPHHHRDMVAAMRRSASWRAARLRTVVSPEQAAAFGHGLQEAREAAARAVLDEPEKLENAELYWVTAKMAPFALDASTDMPPDVIASEHMPEPAGVIAFESGLPPLRVASGPHDLLAPVRILTWSVSDMLRTPVLAIVAWCHSDDVTADHEEFFAWREGSQAGRLPGVWRVAIQVNLALSEPLDAYNYDAEDESILYLLVATWVLMQTPTMAHARTVTPSRDPGARAGRRDRRPRSVKIIELRRLAHQPTAPGETDEKGRVYRHRWVVRGHWRQQPFGPKRSQRRTQWIPPYIKGPEDAPLLPTEHVNVWRR